MDDKVRLLLLLRTTTSAAMAAVVVAVAAMIVSRRPKLVASARYILGTIFGLYGVIKLTGTQLNRWEGTTRLGDLRSDELFWYFFGYSRPFVVILGAAEILAAVVLVLSRTRRLGTLLWIALGTHITTLDLCFGVGGVSYFIMGLTLCCMGLVAVDVGPYLRALHALTSPETPRREVRSAAEPRRQDAA